MRGKLGLATLLTCLALESWAEEPASAPRMIYGLIGQLDGYEATIEDNNGDNYHGEGDDLPYGGGVVQVPIDTRGFIGWESGGALSWDNETTRFALTNNTLYIDIENQFVMLELFMGAYIALPLRPLRFYAAAGPSFLGGWVTVDEPEDAAVQPRNGNSVAANGVYVDLSDKDTDVTVGGYGRVGVDLRISADSYIGISAKYLRADMNFDTTIGEVEFDGATLMLAIGARY